MAEYSKKTVAELTEILKSRGLSHTGKKAELVARLNEDDQKAASEPVEETAAEPPQPPPAAQPAVENTTAPSAEPTTEAQPTTATDQTEDPTTAAASTTYTLNLKASDIDSELAKRKARAERFGTSAQANSAPAAEEATPATTATQPQEENQKNLERAKRFGTETKAISKLDEALPSERQRTNKRKAKDTGDAETLPTSTVPDDPGLKRSFANRGGRGRLNRHRGGGGGAQPSAKPQGIFKQRRGAPAPAYTNEKDKLAAEARKKKFATA